MSEMSVRTFPKSCIKIIYTIYILRQFPFRRYESSDLTLAVIKVNNPLEQNYAVKCLERYRAVPSVLCYNLFQAS